MLIYVKHLKKSTWAMSSYQQSLALLDLHSLNDMPSSIIHSDYITKPNKLQILAFMIFTFIMRGGRNKTNKEII